MLPPNNIPISNDVGLFPSLIIKAIPAKAPKRVAPNAVMMGHSTRMGMPLDVYAGAIGSVMAVGKWEED